MESLNPDYEAMKEFMALQSDNVKTHAEIVDTDLVGQEYMLHIDKNTPPVFTPMMPRSADKREDNTTARITVAPTLMGCYIGYNRAHDDFASGSVQKGENDPFRGGYEICTLPFQHCLKVDNTLVPDAQQSGEHWLVGYTEQTREYKPEKVGKVFVTRIAQKAVSGEKPTTLITMFIEVTREAGFKFSPHIHLNKGYHRAEVVWENAKLPSVMNEEHFVVRECHAGEYQEAKGLTAAFLARHVAKVPVGRIPAFSRW